MGQPPNSISSSSSQGTIQTYMSNYLRVVLIGVSLMGLVGGYAIYRTQKGSKVGIVVDKVIQSRGGKQST